MTDIKGRTAFITGGANGIGLGIARSFARAGAKLALVDLDTDALARAKAELQDITQVETFKLDVSDRNAYMAIAEEAERAVGPVSLLFNNAGVAGGESLKKLTYELWDWYININLYGVINGLMAFLPKMLERDLGGYIVNTSSGAGLAATNSGVLYTTTKYAVVGMTEDLYTDRSLKKAGIGVSVLCPGMVATNIMERTANVTPKGEAGKLTEEQEKRIHEFAVKTDEKLHEFGASIDAVGEMVLKAVQENQLFILTDHYVEDFVKARTEEILKSMPN